MKKDANKPPTIPSLAMAEKIVERLMKEGWLHQMGPLDSSRMSITELIENQLKNRDRLLVSMANEVVAARINARSMDELTAFWDLIGYINRQYGELPLAKQIKEAGKERERRRKASK